MHTLYLNILGPFQCRDAGGANIDLPTRRAEAIIAYLAVKAGREQSRDMLATLLWEDKTNDQARANLRQTLSRLRRALPEAAAACLIVEPTRISLCPEAARIDVVAFETLAVAGTPETLEQAAEIYRGLLLEGFVGCGHAYEDWLSAERRRLEELAQNVLERLLEHYVVSGAVDRGIQIALRLLALDPLQEGVHRTLMRLYFYQDRIGAACQQYELCRVVLAEALDVTPSHETERLHTKILGKVPAKLAVAGGGPERELDTLPERDTLIELASKGRARRREELLHLASIAVLPFAVQKEERAQEYLGEGMAEDIITELGRFPDLCVLSPTTTLSYRSASVTAAEIGTELGTRYVISGSIRAYDGQFRVTARLIESATDRQIWAERYRADSSDMGQLQDELICGIVGPLAGQIESAELQDTRRRRPEDWRAIDYWHRGWHALRRMDSEAIRAARLHFERALEIDPGFARAYVGLASANLSEWFCYSWNHWVFARDEALDYARKAIELDRTDYRAHCMLGMAELYRKDYELARQRLTRVLKLNPNDADMLAHVSFAMALIGEHDLAVNCGRNALRLSPHHPEWYEAFIGVAFFAAGLYEEAIETMAMAPEALCVTPAYIAASYAHLGRATEASMYRQTVYRHYRTQLARGDFTEETTCINWLLSLDPFQNSVDARHYEDGLRKAGFE